MSRRRRNAYSSYYGSRGGSRGLADWFGLLALLCMLVCSVILLVRVLGAGVLTTELTDELNLVLVLLNGLHAVVQLPVRRNVAGKLICAVVALMTGSSWTTIATIGVALMGIGQAMGFSEGWGAGASISGAYFGDKLSLLSDTTVLASSTAGVEVFTHIRNMLYNTVP